MSRQQYRIDRIRDRNCGSIFAPEHLIVHPDCLTGFHRLRYLALRNREWQSACVVMMNKRVNLSSDEFAGTVAQHRSTCDIQEVTTAVRRHLQDAFASRLNQQREAIRTQHGRELNTPPIRQIAAGSYNL